MQGIEHEIIPADSQATLGGELRLFLLRPGVVRPRSSIATRRLTEALCRGINVAATAVLLLLSLPLMLAIAAAIKLTSPGPVFYSQPRVGLNRRGRGTRRPKETRRQQDYGGGIFTILKFRTMTVASKTADQVWATEGDARVTRIGRILRQYRLDELPQLWNVLRGDMNLVGPRPEQPEIFVQLREDVRHLPGRQAVLPGITGLAQVTQHYDQCIEDVRRKADLDLEYIRNRSPLLDLEIMARTLPAVVFKQGAL